jgi:signal peptidase II
VRDSRIWLRRVGWALLVIVLVAGIDQLTKVAARQALEGRGTVPVVGRLLVLRYVENEGAFLSLGSRWPQSTRFLVFTVATGIATVALSVYLFLARNLETLHRIALACIVGGGVGNLIDRIAYRGRVIDFMNLGIGRLRTGIFNVADLAVMVGAVLLIVAPFRKEEGTGPRKPGQV